MRISVLAVFASFVLGAPPAFAGHGGVEPLDRILAHLRAERGGTFYDAEGPFDDGNGGMHYRIKWLTPQGQLIWLDTDARTGRVLGVDRGAPRERFDNGHRNDYDHEPREPFPRDPRWPRWEGGAPVGGGDWRDRDDHNDRGGDHGGGGHHRW
jgi:hypothetical protein